MNNAILVLAAGWSAIAPFLTEQAVSAGSSVQGPAGQLRCDATDLSSVFRDPLAYDGKTFCGRAYFVKEHRWVAFYATREDAEQRRHEAALAIPANSWLPFRGRLYKGYVDIQAILDVDRDCFMGRSSEGKTTSCTPIYHPIYVRNLVVLRCPAVAPDCAKDMRASDEKGPMSVFGEFRPFVSGQLSGGFPTR